MWKIFKHHFVPHEGNEYKPHFLREASITALLSLLLILFIFSLLYGILVIKTDLLSHLVFAQNPAWYQNLILSIPAFITNAYLIVGGVVVLSLVLLIFLEVKMQFPKNIFYGFFLLALILLFLFFSRAILFPQIMGV